MLLNLQLEKCTNEKSAQKVTVGINYCIQNSPLQVVHEFKYLGVIISSNLSGNSHISWTAQKASAKLWSLKRRLKHSTPATKLAIYTTVIRPVLENADVVWDPATKLNIDRLEGVQKKALRFIYNEYRIMSSITNLYNRTRRKINRLKLLFTIVHESSRLSFDRFMQFNTPRNTLQQNPMFKKLFRTNH